MYYSKWIWGALLSKQMESVHTDIRLYPILIGDILKGQIRFCMFSSVSCWLEKPSSLPFSGLRVRTRAPGCWKMVVVGLGDSSGGCSFTTHCVAGLSLDAEVVPLAAVKMSCLLPFPYTTKPNEEHRACPPAFTLSSVLQLNLSLPQSESRPPVLSSLLWFILFSSPVLLYSIHPSNYPLSYSAPMKSQRSKWCVLTTQRLVANDLA